MAKCSLCGRTGFPRVVNSQVTKCVCEPEKKVENMVKQVLVYKDHIQESYRIAVQLDNDVLQYEIPYDYLRSGAPMLDVMNKFVAKLDLEVALGKLDMEDRKGILSATVKYIQDRLFPR
jgi:hypothetical protein